MGVRAELIGELGDADGLAADDAGEPLEGVLELVGVFEAFTEDFVLGVEWKGGGEEEVEFGDGGGGFELVKVGAELAEDDVFGEGGLGDGEFAEVGGAIVIAEGEVEFAGGALVVAEAVTEGFEEALGDEEDGFEVVDGGLEDVACGVVGGGAVEGEEAVGFAMEDVVEVGHFGAESLGEALVGKFGEVGEVGDAPELEGGELGDGEGFLVEELIEGEWEGIRGVVVFTGGLEEGGEVGEVGRVAEADVEGEAEVEALLVGVGDPVIKRGDEEGGEVEEEGVRGGLFEVGGEGFGEGEDFFLGGFEGGGVRGEEVEVGAAGEATGGGESGVDFEGAGGGIDGEEV